MKKRSWLIGFMLMCSIAMTACGDDDKQAAATNTEVADTQANADGTIEEVAVSTEITEEEIPVGKVVSDLTGEFIDENIANQRPIAVMVDNEKKALP